MGMVQSPGDQDSGEVVYILSHCDRQGLTHTTAPEAMLIRGLKGLEFIDVIEPVHHEQGRMK